MEMVVHFQCFSWAQCQQFFLLQFHFQKTVKFRCLAKLLKQKCLHKTYYVILNNQVPVIWHKVRQAQNEHNSCI